MTAHPFSNWPTAHREKQPGEMNGEDWRELDALVDKTFESRMASQSPPTVVVVDTTKRPRIFADDAARTRYFINMSPETVPTVGPFDTCGAAIRWLREKFGDTQVDLWIDEWLNESEDT